MNPDPLTDSSWHCLEQLKNFECQDLTYADIVMVVRGCIMKMYRCGLDIKELKQLLWGALPTAANANVLMQDMLAVWTEKVGSVEDTLHWVAEPLFYHVNHMNHMPFPALLEHFLIPSDLNRFVVGVMDVLFLTSCFNFPVVSEMGGLFWIFARELIQLKLNTSDMLNSYLWGLAMPQTVILLPPITGGYILDSLLDPIEIEITIQGCLADGHTPYVDDTSFHTTIYVYAQSSLTFMSNTRLLKLSIQKKDFPAMMARCDTLVKFIGWGLTKLSAYITDVEFINGGCFATRYDVVHCDHILVKNTSIGLSVQHVAKLFITGNPPCMLPGPEVSFYRCLLAISAIEVDTFVSGRQIFSKCKNVFYANVKTAFIVEDSAVKDCEALGEILMSPGRRPTFVRFTVSTTASIHHFLVSVPPALLFVLQREGTIQPLQEGSEVVSQIDKRVYIARPPVFLW